MKQEDKSSEINRLEQLMEELANSPREPIGKRQPGEKCAYEIYRKELSENTL